MFSSLEIPLLERATITFGENDPELGRMHDDGSKQSEERACTPGPQSS